MNSQIKIPQCQHWDSGFCFYHGFLKADTNGGATGCSNGCFGCDVYKFEHNIKLCNVCGEGFLIPQVEPENGTHFSVCTECHSETADAEQAKKNKEIFKK